jgi:S1-C subfamily serine protease
MTQGELADLGERITIISHPRLGEKILSETMTTGIVSRASRTFDGLAYLQIAAAVNPGSEGAPVFDSHGHVIGVVMATGSEEDVGFATPNQRITNFLKTSSPPADEAPQAMRVWRDASGKHSMTAQLVSFEKELVQLKRADGKVVEVPLGFLGEADQQFLRDWVSANGP